MGMLVMVDNPNITEKMVDVFVEVGYLQAYKRGMFMEPVGATGSYGGSERPVGKSPSHAARDDIKKVLSELEKPVVDGFTVRNKILNKLREAIQHADQAGASAQCMGYLIQAEEALIPYKHANGVPKDVIDPISTMLRDAEAQL